MSNNAELLKEFLNHGNHMCLFVESVKIKTSNSRAVLTDTKCCRGHAVFEILARKLFNLFSRNLLKRLNDSTLDISIAGSDRKIRKLQSNTAK